MKIIDNLFCSLFLFFDAIDDGRPGNKGTIDVVNSPYDLDFIKKSSYLCNVNAQRVKDMAVGDKYTSFVLP
ncbi:MAG: hypothetical protein AB2L20_08820 [Mangrovibacterium sp.]